MKRFFFSLFVFISFQIIYSQSLSVISVRTGIMSLYENGYGLQLSYSRQVKDKLFFVSTLSGYGFDMLNSYRNEVQNFGTKKIQLYDAELLNIGLKFIVGNKFLKPYCSFYWGLLRRSGIEYSPTIIFNEEHYGVKEIFKSDLSAIVGFDFGAMLLLTESLACDVNTNTSYGKVGQSISLQVGLAYLF